MKTIYICSPSAPFTLDTNLIEQGKNNLQKLGFEVIFSSNILANTGNTAGTIGQRVADLEEGLFNSKVDIILPTRGGFNSNEILPHLNFSKIKEESGKKIFCGYSDNTTLVNNLFTKANMQTIYGLNFKDVCLLETSALEQWHKTINNVENFSGFYRSLASSVFRPGKAKGKLIGGNLAVMCWLIGTPYEVVINQGDILFLEDDLETNSYYWQMYLVHLKQAGAFDKISGLIFGKLLPETYFPEGQTFLDILEDVVGQYSFPVWLNADFGHIENPISIPLGISFTMN